MLPDLFANITVAGMPLLFICLGLTQFVKSFGLEGQIVRVVSLLVGFMLGLGYQFSTTPPTDFAGWFAATVFGLGLGIVASGSYDVAKNVVQKTTPIIANVFGGKK